MSAFLELQKNGFKLGEEHLNKSLNEEYLYKVLFDSRKIAHDIIMQKEFTESDFAQIGRDFVEAIAQEYIAANCSEMIAVDDDKTELVSVKL